MNILKQSKKPGTFEAALNFNVDTLLYLTKTRNTTFSVLALVADNTDVFEGLCPTTIMRDIDAKNREMLDSVYEYFGTEPISDELIHGGNTRSVKRLVVTYPTAKDGLSPVLVNELHSQVGDGFRVIASPILDQ